MKRVVLIALVVAVCVLASGPAAAQERAPQAKMKPALLVIDIQNAYLPWMDERDRKFGMEGINYIIALFRDNGFPVIRVYHQDPGQGPERGTEAFEFPKTVPVKDDDPMVVKHYPSAFKKTELDKLLREKGINTLFLVGLSAVGCVNATYHGAEDLDYKVFMVKDAVISHDAALTKAVCEINSTIEYSALKLLLETARGQ